MKTYRVNFQRTEESSYCANVVLSDSYEAVENHFAGCSWLYIAEGTDADIREAERKGMPLYTIQPEELKKDDADTITEEIFEVFAEDEELFVDCIEELDSYNGYLGDDRYYCMDDLDEIYHDSDPSEVLQRAFYGYDADSTYLDSCGNKVSGAFNPNRDYFYYNGYGNLVSSDYKDYSAFLDHYFIDSLLENRAYIYSLEDSYKLSELFDRLEAIEA